jgi:hypothetical protein
MYSDFATSLGFILTQIQQYISSIDPAYMDIIKIFAGSIGWIGILTLYMWLRERRKVAVVKI